MKGQRPYRMQASTLVEVMVAMSLASITFVIGIMIWLQLEGRKSPSRLAAYRLQARELILDFEQSQHLRDEVFERQGLKYLRQVRSLNPDRNLYEVKVTCFSPDNEVLLERFKIIHLDED